MSSLKLDEALLHAVARMAREAGQATLPFHGQAPETALKEDGSPVTAADRAAHALIVSALEQRTPHLPVLSEESPPEAFSQWRPGQGYWLVDPLDGTKEFLQGNGEYTVNVAWVEEEVPTLGVVHVDVRRDDLTRVPTMAELFIDVGATSRADCPIRVGDMAGFVRPLETQGPRLIGKSLDDRIGVVILVETLRRLGYRNVTVREGDGYAGWPEKAPFDRIILTACPPELPQTLVDQLKPGGRLIGPVGATVMNQNIVIVDKDAQGATTLRTVLPVRFVPMVKPAVR